MSDKLPKDVEDVIRDIAGESIIAKLNLENLAHFMLEREEVIAEGWVGNNGRPDYTGSSGDVIMVYHKPLSKSSIPVKLIAKEK